MKTSDQLISSLYINQEHFARSCASAMPLLTGGKTFKPGLLSDSIWRLLSSKFGNEPLSAIVGAASPQLRIAPEKFIHRLSYSHLEMIVDLDDALKRVFYEIECMRGNWSVRELKRQIGSLY